MQERIEQELALLRRVYPNLESKGRWVRIPSYLLPPGWGQATVDVAFLIKEGHPGTPPYGIYVPAGIRFKEILPNNYTEPASEQPPFGGTWGIFSWQPEDGDWRPTTDLSEPLDEIRVGRQVLRPIGCSLRHWKDPDGL